MKRILTALAATLPFAAHAADAITGEVQRQPTNWQAIVMFLIFVVLTLYITEPAGLLRRLYLGIRRGLQLYGAPHPKRPAAA